MVLKYDDAKAEALEASYLGHDVMAQRAETLARLKIRPGDHVLDIGAGPGFLAMELAAATGPTGRVLGIDVSEHMVNRAESRRDKSWLSYVQGDATALPVDDNSFDAAVSTQVAEYMADLTPFCAEIARVLKPGGRALILTTDWDGVAWHSENPERMARVLKAQSTSVAQTNVPRVLAPHLRAAGLAVDSVGCFQIINLDRRSGHYSAGTVPFIVEYLRDKNVIAQAELDAWAEEQDALEERGDYFFSIGRYIFEVSKPRR